MQSEHVVTKGKKNLQMCKRKEHNKSKCAQKHVVDVMALKFARRIRCMKVVWLLLTCIHI
jgi:hypothetical protein